MVKNRIAQIIFQTIYVTLGVLGVIGSLGYFKGVFNGDFYAYYTNLSNYICLGVMVAALVHSVRKARQQAAGAVTLAPTFNFLCVILILVTFLVYNLLLAKEYTVAEYFLNPSNLLMHVILPLMFIAHWIVFCEHGQVRWYYPLLCTVMPLVYVVYALIRAAIVHNMANVSLVYPYFFLDLDALGWGGVLGWVVALLAVFIVIGYIFYFLDNLKTFRQKFRKQPR